MRCSVPNCKGDPSKPGAARGLCIRHYGRWLKHGDPKGGGHVRGGTEIERFLDRMEVLPDGCWLWVGPLTKKGYGTFHVGDGRYMSAHRRSFQLFYGSIPEGMSVDHTCHNSDPECLGGTTCRHRKCVNPYHLEAVPAVENTMRGKSRTAENARKEVCVRGHDLTDPANSYGYNGRRQCKLCARLAARAKFLDPATREAALAKRRAAHRAGKNW